VHKWSLYPSGGLTLTIEKRKEDHIEICLGKHVLADRNWWDDVFIDHAAIPACDLDEIDLEVRFLGRVLSAPMIVSAMTGGSRKAKRYNGLLARAASDFGLGMGVGSQRAGIENEERRPSYTIIRDFDIPLVLANIGAPQLTDGLAPGKGGRLERARNAISSAEEMIGAHATCVHLNYLQEVVQVEGECVVRGFPESVRDLSKDFKLIGKETGAGIGGRSARKIKELGFKAIDVGGLSGTSFSAVESFRDTKGPGRAMRLGRTFWNWGIPTPVCVVESRVGLPMIATGGLRNGLDVGRALALGADCGGMARTLLIAASKGYPALRDEVSRILDELRAVIFLSGSSKASEMSDAGVCLLGQSLELLEQRRSLSDSGQKRKRAKVF
jgi:isopentenyl-diphosphate delta-isomerase